MNNLYSSRSIYLLLIFIGMYCFIPCKRVSAKEIVDSNKVSVVLRIDDYGIDNAAFYEKLLAVIKRTHSKITIGVVPYRKIYNRYIPISDSLIAQLNGYISNDPGIEIALHGYSHENLDRNGHSSEFYGQPLDLQRSMIHEGKSLLESKLAYRISTFIPPWNSHDNATTEGLVLEGFKCISAASYGRIATKGLNPNLGYLPYTIQLTNIIDSYPVKLPNEGGISVVLFHAYDFKEGQPLYSGNSTPEYLSKRRTITLNEFEQFIIQLNRDSRIRFCTMQDICLNHKGDLSVDRYKSSFISSLIPVFWPKVSNESFLYYNGYFNFRNSYSLIWPFIYYALIFISGYLISFKLGFSRIVVTYGRLIAIGVIVLIITTLAIEFFRVSIKYLMLLDFWIGIVFAYLRYLFHVFYSRKTIV